MKKIIIIGLSAVCLIGLSFSPLPYWVFQKITGFQIGGGGNEQIAPDTAKTGKPTVIKLIVGAWGEGGPIKGRYTNISLHYRLAGENSYQALQAESVALPDNYQKAVTKTNQWEAYEFTIPPYPKGTTGEIEYYVDMTFDGYAGRREGEKKIKLVTPS